MQKNLDNMALDLVKSKVKADEYQIIYRQEDKTNCLYKIRADKEIWTILGNDMCEFKILDWQGALSGITTTAITLICTVTFAVSFVIWFIIRGLL